MTKIENKCEKMAKMVTNLLTLFAICLILSYYVNITLDLKFLAEFRPKVFRVLKAPIPQQVEVEDSIPGLEQESQEPFILSAESQDYDLENVENTTKTIYFVGFKEKGGLWPFRECKCTNCNDCYVTADPNHHGPGNIDQFDAVVVNIEAYKETSKLEDLLKTLTKRSPRQRYVMRLHESPRPDMTRPFVNENIPKNFFNWTWSYRKNSDIYYPYGFIIKHKDELVFDKTLRKRRLPIPKRTEILSHKEGTAFWLVSHCNTSIKREDYAATLKKYIDLDILGKCGEKPCTKSGGDVCFRNLSTSHKFYLSFENSICDDYVTEKFYKALLYPVVPIVMGGADYKSIAPPKSYIDVNDFKSVAQLAGHLKSLNQNTEKYLEYFKWKDDHVIYTLNSFCKLCQKLHNASEPVKTIEDAHEWWYKRSDGTSTCTDGQDREYFKTVKHKLT